MLIFLWHMWFINICPLRVHMTLLVIRTYEQEGQRSGRSDIPTADAQMHCSLSAFKVCYVLRQDTKTDGASIRWSVFGSDVFVQVFALILLLRNSWCCFTQTRSNPESAHAVDRSFQSLWWGASPSWREDILAYWLCISVTEWIKTQLPQKFMPRLTFSLNLIQDLLFLVVIWERQSKQISRDLPLDQPRWPRPVEKKHCLARLIWWPRRTIIRPNFRAVRVFLTYPAVSSSFPSVCLWWTIGVGPSTVFVFRVFSVSELLLCYRNVPSGQGRK